LTRHHYVIDSRIIKQRINHHSKEILSCVPLCDLATCVNEVDLGFDPLPDFKTLDLTWDAQNDKFSDNIKEFTNATTYQS